MNLDFFILSGYGQFVWPAFIFAFVSCLYLYLKTKKEFKKQQKMFLNEFEQFRTAKNEVIKQKKTIKKILSSDAIF